MNNKTSHFVVESFPVGPLQCNCTLIGNRQTKKGLVVDPGGDADLILEKAQKMGFEIEQIIHTHAHFDHILAAGVIQKKTNASIELHQEDLFLWEKVEEQCALFGVPQKIILPKPDSYLKEGDYVSCCGDVIHTPGHTPGSLCFWFNQLNLLIAGDTLFKGGIGRTDLWKGSFDDIQKSITQKLFCLDEQAKVITGHGESTILGFEKENNRFLKN